MCQATNKLFADYRRLDSTNEFLDALSLNMGIPIIKIIEVKTGRYGGSWIHPKVAINLAQWCSPEFAVQVPEPYWQTLIELLIFLSIFNNGLNRIGQ